MKLHYIALVELWQPKSAFITDKVLQENNIQFVVDEIYVQPKPDFVTAKIKQYSTGAPTKD